MFAHNYNTRFFFEEIKDVKLIKTFVFIFSKTNLIYSDLNLTNLIYNQIT